MKSNTSDFSDLLAVLGYDSVGDDVPADVLPFIGFLISKAAQSIVETVNAELGEFGITSRHYGILLLLLREDGLRQVTIGETLQIDRTTMVKLIDELEALQFVERRPDPDDRRAYAISLSEKGQAILPAITERVISVEKSSLSQLEQEEVHVLFRILLKLVGDRSRN